MKKRTYVNKYVRHLCKGQKGSFFPLAGPLLGAVAGPVFKKIAAAVLTGVIRKIRGCGSRRRGRIN